MSGLEIVLLVLLLLAVVTAARGIRTVPQGEVWTVERFGAFTRLLQPGLNLIIPYVDRIGRRMNVQEVVLDIPEQVVITRDNASVAVDGIVYYRVMEPAKAAYQVQDLQQALTALSMTNIRSVIGEMDLDHTLSSRERINSALLVTLDGATEPWGVKVNRVEIRGIEPPPTIRDAMEQAMRADRGKRAAILTAEGQQQSVVLSAQGSKQSVVLNAEADRAATILRAEAEREALLLRAQGEAQAITTVVQAIKAAGVDDTVLAYQRQQLLPRLAEGDANKVWFVPTDITGALGRLGLGGAPAAPEPPHTMQPPGQLPA